jgi:hypothetical protein
MANQLPPPGPAPLVPACHASFTAFYNDIMLDPFQGEYTRVMERMDPEVNNGVSHVMLLEQAVGTGPVPQAYLCCALRQNHTRVFCPHLSSRYTGSLDGNPTPWDGLSYAFLGKLTQGVVTTVELHNNAFRTVNNVRAKTYEYIVNHLTRLKKPA